MKYVINYKGKQYSLETGTDDSEEVTQIIFDKEVLRHTQKFLLEEIDNSYGIRGKNLNSEALTNADLVNFFQEKGYLESNVPELEEMKDSQKAFDKEGLVL